MVCIFLRRNFFALVLNACACYTFFVFSGHLAAAQQIQATKYPVPTTVVIGDNVLFECTVLEPPGSNQILQWYIEWDEVTEGFRSLSATDAVEINVVDRPEFNGRGSYKTQYSMSPEAGGYTTHRSVMEISSSTLKDNGYFGCTHQMPGETHRTLLDQKARLTIVPQPTTNPECNLNKRQEVFVLTCVSLQGDPQAHLTWYEGSEKKSPAIQTFNSIEEKETSDTAGRTFVCHARQGDKEVGTCSVTLTGPTGNIDNSPNTKPPTTEASSTLLMTTPGAVVGGDETATSKSANVTAIVVGGVLGTVILVLLLLLLWLWFTKLREINGEATTNATHIHENPVKPQLDLANPVDEGHAYMHLQPHTMQPTAPSQVYEIESPIATESVYAKHTDQHPYSTQPIQVSSNQTEEDPYYTQSIP